MIFAKPYLLLLLLLLIPIIVWYVWKRKSVTAKMQISSVEPFIGAKRT
ncbi:MAG: BatA domain-containing protein, partial [Paludibacteraceae bacterium]|nr:BatA domain-containing protein [Paludibacteraceae bacterium]